MQKEIKLSVLMFLILFSLLSCNKKQISNEKELILEEEFSQENKVFEKKKFKEVFFNPYNKEINTIVFSDNVFIISLNPERKYDTNNLAPILVNNIPISIDLSFLCENITITEVSETEFWFNFQSLDCEKFIIINTETYETTTPFFDMEDSANITLIDFENQVMFGHSWNSDKDFFDTQELDYYLFSTKQKKKYKINTFIGEVPKVDFTDFFTISFTKKNGDVMVFNYEMWTK